ncbi:SRPBCC family protein, partial [Streptomyces sp. SID7982]|nr:SRPBCC family protein [Streptomyces sp. SID7982]
MKTYELVDEAWLTAGPDAVWEALLGELSGAARWWVPDNTF